MHIQLHMNLGDYSLSSLKLDVILDYFLQYDISEQEFYAVADVKDNIINKRISFIRL